jgi:hypothetical protein
MKTEELDCPVEKYKIWDTENKIWYRPTYPNHKQKTTEEILFSQAGELWMRKNDGQLGSPDVLTHLNGKYKPCLYTGLKDVNETKTYVNDVVQLGTEGKGIIILQEGAFFVEMIDTGEKFILNFFMHDFANLGNAFEFPGLLEKGENDERA